MADSPASQSGSRTILRHAILDDIPGMVRLERSSTEAAHWPEASYQAIFRSDPVRVALVAQCEAGREGEILGFVVARITGAECELENIVVAAGQRRRGVGSDLLSALAKASRERGASRIFLEVRESNLAARKLYEKRGFELTGNRKSYYRDPTEDAVLYALKL